MDALYLTEIMQTSWLHMLDKYWGKGDTFYSDCFDIYPEWLFQYYNELPLGESIGSAYLMWNS